MSKTPWLDWARDHLGVEEYPGAANNQRVLDMFVKAKASWTPTTDSTPWCAALVGAALEESGYKGSGSLMARSYLEYGTRVKPQPGAIAVYPRGAPPAGHVAIVESVDNEAGTVVNIEGNVADSVKRVKRRIDSAIDYRWPVMQDDKVVVEGSRKWTLMQYVKYIMGLLGFGTIGINFGSAAGLGELTEYLEALKGAVEVFGWTAFAAISGVMVLIAVAMQEMQKEDKAEGRYKESGKAG